MQVLPEGESEKTDNGCYTLGEGGRRTIGTRMQSDKTTDLSIVLYNKSNYSF